MAKISTGLLLGLGLAGVAAAVYFMKRQPSNMPTYNPPAPGPSMIDPKLQHLQAWASGDPNPVRMQFVNSLDPADLSDIYYIVTTYFDPNPQIPLPADQQAIWDRIAGPWGYG